MSQNRVTRRALVLLGGLCFLAAPAYAQATRTWVSGVGDDANPCSRTAPCKTFAGAISKTAAKGEINVLDPGGFGAVTITKSISIEAVGVIAGVLAAGVNGIIVNAAPTDVVVIRGLTIEGLGTGLDGIRFLNGGALHVEDCTINGFTQKAINFVPSAATGPNVAQLFVKNTVIRNNVGASAGGILVKPGLNFSAAGALEGVVLDRNRFGLRVEDNATISVMRSTISGNGTNGVMAMSVGFLAQVIVTDSQVTNNTNNGIRSDGSAAIARIAGLTISGNGVGLAPTSGGLIISFGNNAIDGNPPSNNLSNGTPTSTMALQ